MKMRARRRVIAKATRARRGLLWAVVRVLRAIDNALQHETEDNMKVELPGDNPAKYDDVSEVVLRMTKAVGALVIIIEGEHGNGFSVSTVEPDLIATLPALLRNVARGIEDANRAKAN